MSAPWSVQSIQLSATIGGAPVPVSAVHVDFALNTIPAATLNVPLGVDALRGGTAFPLGTLAGASVEMPVVVTCAIATTGDGVPVPSGPFTLFQGVFSGYGFHRGPSGASLRISARHWLGALDSASALSRYSQPSNPADYTMSAIVPQGAGAVSRPLYASLSDYGGAITQSNLQADMWMRAARPYFEKLVQADAGLKVPELNIDIAGGANPAALAALAATWSYPGLALAPAIQDEASTLMADHMERLLLNGAIVNHTIWAVLVGRLAPEFGVALVPRVRDALVVPFVPTLNQPHATVFANAYYAADIQGAVPRPLRAVGILGGAGFGSGADGRPAGDAPLGVQGWYANPKAPNGTVLIERAPGWAERLISTADANAPVAAGAQGRAVATANDPAAAGAPAPENRQIRRNTIAAASNALSAFARARYAFEVARDKQGFIAGPFRMDVAPGSMLAVEVPGAASALGGGKDLIYGAVTHVSLVVDAAGASAGASFQLSHVRAADENSDPSWSLSAHPVYAKPFVGAGLLASPAPPKTTGK